MIVLRVYWNPSTFRISQTHTQPLQSISRSSESSISGGHWYCGDVSFQCFNHMSNYRTAHCVDCWVFLGTFEILHFFDFLHQHKSEPFLPLRDKRFLFGLGGLRLFSFSWSSAIAARSFPNSSYSSTAKY